MSQTKRRLLVFAAAWLLAPALAQAQFENKAMAIGEMNHVYSETGGQQEYWCCSSQNALAWPAINRSRVLRADALWMGAQNIQGADGEEYPVRVVHIGPRANGAGEFFPVEFTTVSKFEPPAVTVEGLESFEYFPDNDVVDPNLPADRMILARDNTLLGITLTKRVYAFAQEAHDNYHIQEFVLTNTGNVDEDDEIELEQSIEGVYLHFQRRYTLDDGIGRVAQPGPEWGANVMNDIVGDGMEDYDVDLRAQYTWLGNYTNSDGMDDLGAPKWTDNQSWSQPGDAMGRLTAPHFIGTATLHADQSAADRSDDPNQPSTTGHLDADDPLVPTSVNAFDISQMRPEYELLASGHMYPHHADLVDLDGDFLTPDGEPMMGRAGGWTSMWSYGPYNLEYGDSVRIVIAEGVDGLSMEESSIIGNAFWELAGGERSAANTELATTPNITYRDVTMGKNQWWWSGRDSLFQTFENAVEAYQGSDMLSSYPIPEPPRPPASFAVTSGVGNIDLSWTTYDGANPSNGFEIYRSENYIEGLWQNNFNYECIAGCEGTPELGPEARNFADTAVNRGINYFYYIQAVGDVNNDPTAGTPTGGPLKSNRYWTQTYDPAALKRAPGETTSSFRVVPNPFNVASDADVRWPGPREERIGFLDIPGNCTIRIYTERGDLVRTIEHDDGSGDEFWDVTTEAQQLVVSGLYIVVVDDHDTGERVMKKFVIIR